MNPPTHTRPPSSDAELHNALDHSASLPARDPASVVLPCPLGKLAIEVLVQGADGVPIPGITVQLALSDLQVATQATASSLPVRFEGLATVSYSLSLPAFDQDAWKLLSSQELPGATRHSTGDISWDHPHLPTPPASPHRAEAGDCLSSIAFQYGFAPATLWNDPANQELRALRKSRHILLPGDLVHIPPIRPRSIPASPGNLYILQLTAVPEILRIRFLDYSRQPRAATPYLLQIRTADGHPVPDREGKTDADGFLTEPIPPSAVSGEVWLGTGLDREEIPLILGQVFPIQETIGLQSRLNALNYPCGDESGVLGENTRRALGDFQREHQLPVTGEPDQATLARLEQLFLS